MVTGQTVVQAMGALLSGVVWHSHHAGDGPLPSCCLHSFYTADLEACTLLDFGGSTV